ncbi:MAG: Fatty acid metabolism regulator protein [Syntrophorhabdus sp. PtaU1.Bin058]|nr:MAG: Fatty acid metabolism regulator protein [Syntrophorhabdus sp. PtaU1.Bin058]
MKAKDNQNNKSTEDRIMEHAIKLFLKKGYHGTTIDDITRSARLTKGSFYWYFRSKEEMLERIFLKFENLFLDRLAESLNAVQGGTLDKIAKFIRFIPAFAYYNPELCVVFTTLSGELVGTRHKIEAEIRRIYKRYQDFLAEIMVQGIKEGVVKKDLNPDLVASVIIAFHNGILFQWFMNKGRIDERAYVDTFNRVLLKGFLADKTRFP